MEPFKKFTSRVAQLPLQDVDTDLIIPAEFLTSISRTGYGEHLFRRLRDADPNFCLNKEGAADIQILITNSNFGCGSSREHAVWALQGWGFQAVIAPSFADIFSSNSAKNGLLLIELPKNAVNTLLKLAEDCTVTVDLKNQLVSVSTGQEYSFEYDPFKKHCLLNGLDELEYLLSKQQAIKEHFSVSQIQKFQHELPQKQAIHTGTQDEG